VRGENTMNRCSAVLLTSFMVFAKDEFSTALTV
jgi:hypothetical protein